jgi:hypothetical protein
VLKDRKRHPNRRLGLVFLARDYLHLARYELERTQGMLTEKARRYLQRVVAIHREHFRAPNDSLHGYSAPLYQSALELLGVGFDLGHFLAISGDARREPGAQPIQHHRCLDEREAREFLEWQLAALLAEATETDEIPFEDVA